MQRLQSTVTLKTTLPCFPINTPPITPAQTSQQKLTLPRSLLHRPVTRSLHSVFDVALGDISTRLRRVRVDEMGAMTARARFPLLSCCSKNSSSLVTILMRSGVVEREIISWNWSHDVSPFTKICAGLHVQRASKLCQSIAADVVFQM